MASAASSLILLGEISQSQRLAIVRGLLKKETAPDPPFVAALRDVLSYAAEPATSGTFDERVKLERSVEGAEDLRHLLEARGMTLLIEPGLDFHFDVRFPAGLERSARDLITRFLVK